MVRSRPISIDDDRSPADLIEAIVDGTFHLPETGDFFRCPIQSIVIASDLPGREKDLLKGVGLAGRFAIIADSNTVDVLGNRLARNLPNSDLVVLDTPVANESHAQTLIDRTRHADSLIAAGSGTLNDLCKYVSHQRQRPYAVFPSAPSMNGYTTATASISRGGEKLSLPAAPPLGVFFDLDVLAGAPERLIQAGIGDCLCRSTAQIDWLLSHLFLDTLYMATPFALQSVAEADLLRRMREVRQGNLDAMRALVHLLTLGGLGMLIAGSSQPGSQSEHLISHYIDMFCRPHPGTLHGEQVGLATWTVANLQHDVLARAAPPVLAATAIDPASMAARYGKLSLACQQAVEAKSMTGLRLEFMNQKLEQTWPALRTRLGAIALSPDCLKTALGTAGVAMDAEELGIHSDFYGDAVRHARELRDRYTMLDLAADAGLLDPFVDQRLAKKLPT